MSMASYLSQVMLIVLCNTCMSRIVCDFTGSEEARDGERRGH